MTDIHTPSNLAAVDQSDDAAYYNAVFMAAHEAVVAVGNANLSTIPDVLGNAGRTIRYRPEVIMSALATVCASFVAQSGDFPDRRRKRLAADALRDEFLKQVAGFEAQMQQAGYGIPAATGLIN